MQSHRYQKWLRVGPHTFNKNFIIRSLEHDGTPLTADIPVGGVRVICLPGDPITLEGEQAAIFKQEMLEEAPIIPLKPDPHRTASTGGTLTFPQPNTGESSIDEGDSVDRKPGDEVEGSE